MSDPTYPVFPVFAFLSFVLVLIPLPWHFQAWNAGTCLYMIWTALACLNQFINSIVWHANALNPAPVWCDISSRFIIGSSVAIPAASLCINRRLYKIATAQGTMVSRAQKRRAVYEDMAIGLGLPIIEMAFQYIVSGHRFNIFEDIGCFPVTINTWLAYVLVATWPIMIGLISSVFCIMTLRAFYKRHAQFNDLLASNASLTINRYFRLMALACADLLCTVPFAAYSIYLNLTAQPLAPYRGWADLHFDYSRVEQIPATIWHLNQKTVISIELSRWMLVVCGFVFFMFFGFAEEARRNYRLAYASVVSSVTRIVCRVFRIKAAPKATVFIASKGAGMLPVFVPRPPRPEKVVLSTTFSSSDAFSVTTDISNSINHSSFTLHDEKTKYEECFTHAY